MASQPSTGRPARAGAPGAPGRPCSIAGALKIVGEKWALLALRELHFGNHRFGQIARNTGAPRDVLTARLRSLEDAGIVYRRRYHDHPPRFEYHLTAAGRDLRDVLTALRSWGDRWLVSEPPVIAEHACGHELDTMTCCRHCGAEVGAADLRLRFTASGWDRTGPVRTR